MYVFGIDFGRGGGGQTDPIESEHIIIRQTDKSGNFMRIRMVIIHYRRTTGVEEVAGSFLVVLAVNCLT